MRRVPPRLGALTTALPDFGLAGSFLLTWIAPEVLGAGTLRSLVMLILLEFIVIHSSSFMGLVMVSDQARRRRVTGLLVLGGFYSLFAGGFALGFHSWWPLLSFWGLTGNRILGVVVGQPPTGAEKAYVMKGWAMNAAFYIAAVSLTCILPVPALGVHGRLASRSAIPGEGLWVDSPERALATGFLYFAAVAVAEMRAGARRGTGEAPVALSAS